MTRNKLLAISSALALAGLISSTAIAIPPPDTITLCPSDAKFQKHHWNMLGGAPYTKYAHLPNYPDPAAPWIVNTITAVQYGANCQWDIPGPLVSYYANAELAEVATVIDPDVGGIGSTGVLVDREIARRTDKKKAVKQRIRKTLED